MEQKGHMFQQHVLLQFLLHCLAKIKLKNSVRNLNMNRDMK